VLHALAHLRQQSRGDAAINEARSLEELVGFTARMIACALIAKPLNRRLAH
jgi:hypothetical protein